VYILLLPGFGMVKYAEGGSVRAQVRCLSGQYMGLFSLASLRYLITCLYELFCGRYIFQNYVKELNDQK
jgi:hypothetical protein